MSWSYKITTLYLGFVALILSLVFISSHNKEELVSKDYYAQELKYQQRIDAINNANALPESIKHQVTKTGIIVMLPSSLSDKQIEGEISFYCPADASKDLSIKMSFDTDGKQIIPLTTLQDGMYKMRLIWTLDGRPYYKEEVINIKK